MLQLTIEGKSLYDEKNETFLRIKGQTIQLEHSLVSVSKWESKWKKPFLSTKEKTHEETLDYIRCMTITQGVDPLLYLGITDAQIDMVNAYMNDSMTATVFGPDERDVTKASPRNNNKPITNEEIYYYMDEYRIPHSCAKWHLNRLLTLIRVHSAKNKPQKKQKVSADARAERSKVNAARRAKLHSRG